MAAGGHLEFWWLDWSKYKNDARNVFSMPKLLGKVVLHSFWCQFVFKLHFQFGRRRPFLILASHKFCRHFREGHGNLIFSKYFKKLKSSVKLYYALSGHGTPRLHPTICTDFLWLKLSLIFRIVKRPYGLYNVLRICLHRCRVWNVDF